MSLFYWSMLIAFGKFKLLLRATFFCGKQYNSEWMNIGYAFHKVLCCHCSFVVDSYGKLPEAICLMHQKVNKTGSSVMELVKQGKGRILRHCI